MRGKIEPSQFEKLSENEHYRYLGNSKKVAHAAITTESDELIAHQYSLDQTTPAVRPLKNITQIERFGATHYRAESPNGTRMISRRFVNFEYNNQSFRLATFSPEPKNREPFWGGKQENIPMSTDSNLPANQLNTTPNRIKGGEVILVVPEDIVVREVQKRTPSQNDVMGGSARDEFERVFHALNVTDLMRNTDPTRTVNPQFLKWLENSMNAKLLNQCKTFADKINSNHRPEWLHRIGHSLSPLTFDTQNASNLAASPKWANTEMMILERIAKYFAINQADTQVKINCDFEMLANSEITSNIYFDIFIEMGENKIKLTQNIATMQNHPMLRKASDLAQSVLVLDSMAQNIPPDSKQIVQQENNKRTWVSEPEQKSIVLPEDQSDLMLSQVTMTYHYTINRNITRREVEASVDQELDALLSQVAPKRQKTNPSQY